MKTVFLDQKPLEGLSMGFKSGDNSGQGRVRMWLSLRNFMATREIWHLALSTGLLGCNGHVHVFDGGETLDRTFCFLMIPSLI
jgi:hypothetical protein